MSLHTFTVSFEIASARYASSILAGLWLLIVNDPFTSFILAYSSKCIVGKFHTL